MKLSLIHKEWKDEVILDSVRLYRLNIKEETADYILDKNKLIIKWHKWGEEIFIKMENEIYYLCDKINIINLTEEEECFVDNINKIIYRESTNEIGKIYCENDELIIDWNCEIENINKNIDHNKDNLTDKQKINNKEHIIDYIKNNIKENIKDNINDNINNNIIKNINDNIYDYNLNENLNENLNDNLNDNLNYYLNKNNQIEINIIESTGKIPKIIHFIYGFKQQKEEFELYRYIAIKSAFDINKPDNIYFYYFYEPYGYWWEKIKPILTLQKIDPPNEIFGNPIYHYAHKADIIRIEKLIKYGGIYLDIDTICLKSFDDLLDYDFVMGHQNNSDNSNIYGLCNAVILSKPNSFFANKWMETYKTFKSKGRDEYWDEHSVLKPYELSKIYSKDIKILNSNAFFYPLWYDINDILFNENFCIENYKDIIKNNYCIHLWDTYSGKYLKSLNQASFLNKNTLYNIFSRKFLRNNISLVFLTYNRPEKTKICLESFLNILERDDIEELIILDNNSNKDLTDYLKEFQDKNEKIKLIFSSENLGVCGGRIILFKEAIGDIIISLDSDTILLDNSFIEKIKFHLYDESNGLVGISGSYIKSWEFGSQVDIDDIDQNEYIVDHIAGCCQAFRKDLFLFGFGLDKYYGKFWVEDTDLSMQSLYLNKNNFRINPKIYINHQWGGSGIEYKDLFVSNWQYFVNKWKGKVLTNIKK